MTSNHAKHPAKFSEPLLPILARYVDGARSILDPFAGTGRVGRLKGLMASQPVIIANEIEPEWVAECRGNGCDIPIQGDARTVSRGLGGLVIEAIVTSPAYGNRMADAANWAEGRKHSTYTGAIRETTGDPSRWLQPGNAGAMQWGDEYRELHREAWREAWRVLVPGGRLVLNIADHYRDGELQRVPEWHVSALLAIGFTLLDWVEVPTARYGFGANADLRAPELVILIGKLAMADGPAWRWWPPVNSLEGELWAVKPEPVQLGLFGAAS